MAPAYLTTTRFTMRVTSHHSPGENLKDLLQEEVIILQRNCDIFPLVLLGTLGTCICE